MAKERVEISKSDVAVISNERTVSGPVAIRPAQLIDAGLDVAEIKGLPAEFDGADTLAGFPPSAKFEKPGECVFGEFVGMREGVGPNASRLYEISIPNGESSTTVAVWGSAAIDRLFDSAYPAIQQGDRLAFIYIGEKATKRAQNPVKLFTLKVKRGASPVQTATAV